METRLPGEHGLDDRAIHADGPKPAQRADDAWQRLRSWLAEPDNALFAALLGLSIALVWAFPYVPTQDGPSHVGNAAIIAGYDHPEREAFRAYYELDPRLAPNVLGYVVLAALVAVLPPLLAEKLFLSGYVVLFAMAVRYAMGAFGRSARPVALLGFPLVFGIALHMGFYNYAIGQAVWLLVVGYCMRHLGSFSPRRGVVFGLLVLLLYFSHLLALALGLMAIGILSVGSALSAELRGARGAGRHWRMAGSSLLVHVGIPFAACLPALALLAVHLAGQAGSTLQLPTPSEIGLRAAYLLMMGGIVSLSGRELLPVALLASFVFGAALYSLYFVAARRRTWDRMDWILAVAAALIFFYLVVPHRAAGGWYIAERMGVLIYAAVLLWLGSQTRHLRWRGTFRAIAVVSTVALLASRAVSYSQLNELLRRYAEPLRLVAPNTTLLSATPSPSGRDSDGRRIALLIEPFLHAAAYATARRGVVVLDNFHAAHPQFPVRYRAGLDPIRILGAQRDPTKVRIAVSEYALRSGGTVDHVLLWDLRDGDRQLESVRFLLSELDGAYDLVFVTGDEPRARLYRRRGLANPLAAPP